MLADAVAQCHHCVVPFRVCFLWLQKEMVEILQSLQKAEKCRGLKLDMRRWSLVLESAYRQVKTLHYGHTNALKGIAMKINWCRSMKWMTGMKNAGDLNMLLAIEALEVVDPDDAAAPVLPDLHAAMWRNYDLEVEFNSELMLQFPADHGEFVQGYKV